MLFDFYELLYQKSNLHYTRGITPKRVMSGGYHLRNLAPRQHSLEEMSQRWRTDLNDPGIEPQTSSTESDVLTNKANYLF